MSNHLQFGGVKQPGLDRESCPGNIEAPGHRHQRSLPPAANARTLPSPLTPANMVPKPPGPPALATWESLVLPPSINGQDAGNEEHQSQQSGTGFVDTVLALTPEKMPRFVMGREFSQLLLLPRGSPPSTNQHRTFSTSTAALRGNYLAGRLRPAPSENPCPIIPARPALPAL